MMFVLRVMLVAVLVGAWAGAQEPGVGPLTTLRIGTKIVSVAAFIRDKQGRPLGGVTADDLVLKQDGQAQAIRYFSQGSELPLTLDLVVDTSGSQQLVIADETAASMVFFRSMLGRKEDRAALIQFDMNVVELQPLTSDVENLQRSLNYLSYPHPSVLKGNRGGTLLYDAICGEVPKMAAEPGRKAMLILTDGEDFGSRHTLEQAVAAAQQADVVVYSIYYSSGRGTFGLGRPGTGGDRRVLEKLASETGGEIFDAGLGVPLRQIYERIGEQLRLEYLLGYRPPDSAPGSYHKIELKMKDGNLKVAARKGYYTPK
jgi:Ca-activated chloride channel family protein